MIDMNITHYWSQTIYQYYTESSGWICSNEEKNTQLSHEERLAQLKHIESLRDDVLYMLDSWLTMNIT